MSRYDIADWCDFVRGVVDPEAEERMREHLDSGSSSDRRTVAALRRVAEVGKADRDDPIPERALRVARAAGSVQRSASAEVGPTSLLKRLPFTIAFDSLLEGAPAGTRDLQTGHRQLIFESGEYSVEVRLEHEIEPPSTVVVGQVLRRDDATRPVTEVPILIVAKDRIVGQAASGRFGEFQAEGLPPRPLKLCVLLADGESLELPLDVEAEPSHPHEE